MFIITKTFTDDEGHLFTKVNPKQYGHLLDVKTAR